MKKQTRIRLGLMLLVLTLVGLTGSSGLNAQVNNCRSYGDCQICSNVEQACLEGTMHPDCGGDYNCCSSRTEGCWRCCVWY